MDYVDKSSQLKLETVAPSYNPSTSEAGQPQGIKAILGYIVISRTMYVGCSGDPVFIQIPQKESK